MHAFLKTGKLGPSGNESSTSSSSSKMFKSSTKGKRSGPKPWVEKYRPRSIEDVVYQDEVVSVLKKTLEGADLPNLLFYGPPGTGKTSTILATARELFGEIYKDRVMELNASDERGIQVIREKVKKFAQTSVSSVKINDKMCPSYKIIILDEADSMTSDAQAALRRTMETQSKSTRFCLLCNYVSRIIDPITSRCSKFRFKPLAKDVVLKHLSKICVEEKVHYEADALETLIDTCEGDLRRAITSLQSVACLKAGETISAKDVYEITGVIPSKWITELFEVCQTDSYDKLSAFVDEFIMNGYSAVQLISQIHDATLSNEQLSEDQKRNILDKIGVCDYRLCTGADEYLQIMDLCSTIMQQLCHPSK